MRPIIVSTVEELENYVSCDASFLNVVERRDGIYLRTENDIFLYIGDPSELIDYLYGTML